MTREDAIRISGLHQIFYDDERLSNQQKDIALMYAFGATIDEIADIKGIKSGTVRLHLDTAKATLGAVTLSSIKSAVFLRMTSLLLSKIS
ncbi:DNA-binding response regulator [Salmonella enterica]|nr:DNA-binding response regulator [Salmonella enterica]